MTQTDGDWEDCLCFPLTSTPIHVQPQVRAVMQAARENTDDEADDGGPGQGMPDPTPQSPSTSSSTSSTSQPPSESSSPLFVGKNVRELRTIIHLAGLSSRGLLEKHEVTKIVPVGVLVGCSGGKGLGLLAVETHKKYV